MLAEGEGNGEVSGKYFDVGARECRPIPAVNDEKA